MLDNTGYKAPRAPKSCPTRLGSAPTPTLWLSARCREYSGHVESLYAQEIDLLLVLLNACLRDEDVMRNKDQLMTWAEPRALRQAFRSTLHPTLARECRPAWQPRALLVFQTPHQSTQPQGIRRTVSSARLIAISHLTLGRGLVAFLVVARCEESRWASN